MRLIADGAVDRDGVSGLAARLGYSDRQLHRLLLAEVGAGAQSLAPRPAGPHGAGADRDDGDAVRRGGLRGRLRQHPAVQRHGPRGVRDDPARAARGRRAAQGSRGAVARSPVAAAAGPATLRRRRADAAPRAPRRCPASRRSTRRPTAGRCCCRTARPPSPCTTPATTSRCELSLADPRDVVPAVARVRRLLDLDADSAAVDEVLAADPLLAPLVAAWPGVRVPGAVDGAEMAVRAVIGQQVSVAGARTVAARLSAAYGKPVTAHRRQRGHPPLPHRRGARRGRPRRRCRCPAAAAAPWSRCAPPLAEGRIDLDAGADRDETTAGAARPAGHRPVDRRLRADARARRPRRPAHDRPRRAPRPGAPRRRRRPRVGRRARRALARRGGRTPSCTSGTSSPTGRSRCDQHLDHQPP